MVNIVNISPPDTDRFGKNKYSLRINTTELFQFTHVRSEPLSELLQAAVDHARHYEIGKTIELIRAMEKRDPEYRFNLNKED